MSSTACVVFPPTIRGTAQWDSQHKARAVADAAQPLLSTVIDAKSGLRGNSDVTSLILNRSFLGDARLVELFAVLGFLDHGLHLADRQGKGDGGGPIVRFPNVETVDLSSCDLTPRVCQGLIAMMKSLPKLKSLYLGDNFRSQPGAAAGGRGNAAVAEPTRYFALGWQLNDKEDLHTNFIDTLCEVWEQHPSLTTLTLDPWLTKHHPEFQQLRCCKLTSLRVAAAKEYERQLGLKEPDSPHFYRMSRDPSVAYHQAQISESLLKAAAAATSTDVREQIVQLQLTERKERERIARHEGIAKEKMRQVIRGRSSSQAPGAGGGGALGPEPLETRPRGKSRGVEGTITALNQLEEELRLMVQQKEVDSYRRLLARFAKR